MTGRKSGKVQRKKASKQSIPQQQPSSQIQFQTPDDSQLGSSPANIKKEQPPQPQIVKKILKAENDEAKLLKTVFKSNPDTQMKDFIKKASTKPPAPQAAKVSPKTPAENHPPAVAQELLETDDDVADNLAKLFRASKSYKNI